MEYNEVLKALREDKDLTQTELGKIFNANQITISQYERGARQPSLEVLIKYAKYFKVSLDYIAGLTNDPKPNWNVSDKQEKNTNNKSLTIKQKGKNNKIGNIKL